MMRLVLGSLLLILTTVQATSDPVTVLKVINTALVDRDDVSRVLEYMWKSSEELKEALPVSDDQGNKLKYTFFAPSNAAIRSQLPQDVADPFSQDEVLRKEMLLRHFARQVVTKDDLKKMTELKMADAKVAKITHQGDVNIINEAEIKPEAIDLGLEMGVVYVVDRVFVTSQEISDSLAKFPSRPWFAGVADLPKEATAVDDTPVEPIRPPIPPGGFFPTDVNSADVKEMADFATQALASSSNAGPVKLIEIKAASVQTVAGTNYQLTLSVAKKTGDEAPMTCEVTIFDPLPSDKDAKRRMTESRCTPIPAKSPSSRTITADEPASVSGMSTKTTRQVPGGYTPAKIDDSDVKEIANFAATTISKKSNSGTLTVVEIISAATQVVAGTNYKLKLKLTDTTKNEGPKTCEATIWDQSWSGLRELSEWNCDGIKAVRTTRQVPGGYKPAKNDDSDVKEMANFAATTISKKSNSGTLTVVEIISAATQVVAGTNYKLKLKLTDTTKNEGPKTCEATIWDQSWSGLRELSEWTCDGIKAVRTARNSNDAPAPTVDLPEPVLKPVQPPKTGGYETADPSSAPIQKMATFAATTLSTTSNAGPLTLVKVTKAATQVVSGTNYKMTIELIGAEKTTQTCEVIVWNQPWSGKTELSQSDCDGKTGKTKRQVEGGWSDVKVDDAEVKEMANFAATTIASKSNSSPLKVIEIISASTQVVAGRNYQLKLKLVDAVKNNNPQTCEVTIWEQPGTKSRELTKSDCKPTRKIVGGWADAKVDDAEVKEMANFAATTIASQRNSSPLKVAEIISASTQLVAGTIYKLKLKLVDAAKNDNPQMCEATVFNQPWTKTTELTKFECDTNDKPKKTRRESPPVLGGYRPVDVDESTVKEMATFATNAISAKTNSGPVKLITVTSASKQLVQGINYKLVLQLSQSDPNDGPLTCEVVVHDPLPSDKDKTRTLLESKCGPTLPKETVQKPTKN